jgi:shikimate kinase
MIKSWAKLRKLISVLFRSRRIWFILGLSGAGKTYFSNYLAQRDNLLHMNIDERGINYYDLRVAWELFERTGATASLLEAITEHYQKAAKSGAVLSFTSEFVISSENVTALIKDARVIYISGSRGNCFRSFLEREEKTPRVPADKDKTAHWNKYNKKLLQHVYMPDLAPYTIDAFIESGARKPVERIYREAKSI